MKLVDMNVKEYLRVLKSNAPAPGGGSASALAGAQAIGLLLMVAELTIGNEKYSEYQEICKVGKKVGSRIYEGLSSCVDRDADAFKLVTRALKLPKGTEEEKAVRKESIAEATLIATEIPYSIMEYAHEGLKLAKTMLGRSNPNASSDLGVAALNLLAAIKGAWLNVKINLPGVKDEIRARALKEGGEKICREAEALANDLYIKVLNQL